MQHAIERGLKERALLDRQLSQDEKRMGRSSRTTSIPLNFNVGRIVLHENDYVRFHLSSFYESIGTQSERKIELALNEFFAKGIIGVLARTNRQYLVGNPSREKIFLQLLKSLRELFVLVAQRDRVGRQITRTNDRVDQLIYGLSNQEQACFIRGTVVPETELAFMLPEVRRQEEGEVVFIDKAASVNVQAGQDVGHRQLLLKNIEGEQSTQQLKNSDLQGIYFRPDEGQIVWELLAPVEDDR